MAERLLARLEAPALTDRAQALRREVAEHRLDPYTAADNLLALLRDGERIDHG
jgi:hypothetical protein